MNAFRLFPDIARRHLLAIVTSLMAITSAQAGAQQVPSRNWVGSWMASPQPTWDGGADSVLPINVPLALNNQTIRETARISLGGSKVRIILSNAFGKQPILVGAVHVAVAKSASSIIPSTDRIVTFDGSQTAVVAAGAPLVSDPIDLIVADLSDISVSVYLPKDTPVTTFHYDGRETAYIVSGDEVAAKQLGTTHTTTARVILSGIQTAQAEKSGSVVAIGDSITDGHGATVDANGRWPDFLAKRLLTRKISVLNAGISGGRLLRDRVGANALARFDRDVLSQPNLKAIVVLIGINDIGWPNTPFESKEQEPTAQDIISGYQQLITRAHARGVKIFGGTLTPFQDALVDTPVRAYFDVAKERTRQKVNQWIRTGKHFDGVIDFDAVVRDPSDPTRLKPVFDSGDHLHPNDAGNKAMADAVDLNMVLGN